MRFIVCSWQFKRKRDVWPCICKIYIFLIQLSFLSHSPNQDHMLAFMAVLFDWSTSTPPLTITLIPYVFVSHTLLVRFSFFPFPVSLSTSVCFCSHQLFVVFVCLFVFVWISVSYILFILFVEDILSSMSLQSPWCVLPSVCAPWCVFI